MNKISGHSGYACLCSRNRGRARLLHGVRSYRIRYVRVDECTCVSPGACVMEYTLEQIAKHNHASSCWLVVSTMVLDVTHFLGQHPGG